MTLISPLDAGSAAPTSGSASAVSKDLNQQDFMTLMLAQMKNQDPTDPLDPNQFMSQLAQFSTVSGILQLQNTVSDLAGSLTAGQALQTAGLIGHDVLVEGGRGRLTEGGSLRGMAVLPESADAVLVQVSDSHGRLVRSFTLGPQASGQVYFNWDGLADDGSPAPEGTYQVQVEAQRGETLTAVASGLAARVESVTLGSSGAESTLNLAGGESVWLSQVQQIL